MSTDDTPEIRIKNLEQRICQQRESLGGLQKTAVRYSWLAIAVHRQYEIYLEAGLMDCANDMLDLLQSVGICQGWTVGQLDYVRDEFGNAIIADTGLSWSEENK